MPVVQYKGFVENMARVVIIGAGLTGLSTAYHLEQQGFFDYKILEKEAQVGGLCRSIHDNGFTFDYTGHLLHINNNYAKELIDDLVGLDKFNYIKRRSFIYSHEVFSHYPFQTNLYGLPATTIADCIKNFITRKKINNPKTFYQWVLTNFGAGFAKHFFIPYQEKQFCRSARTFSAQWTGRFVPQTSLEDIIRGIQNSQTTPIGYNSCFYYPKMGGIEIIPNSFAKQLTQQIHTNHEVKNINLKNKVITCTNGTQYPFDILINTAPLNQILKKIIDTSSSQFYSQHKKLAASSVLNINLGIARKNISTKHWVYFPEKKYPFYRLGFSSNFSDTITPSGCSSLYIECAYRNTYSPETIPYAIEQACTALNIKQHEIIAHTIIELPTAYTLYTPWRDTHINKLLARLQEVGVYSIGRYGSWKYASMQEALCEGRDIAEHIVGHEKRPLLTKSQTHVRL